MLEYIYFDFSVFSNECDKKVHSFSEFLAFVDKEQVLGKVRFYLGGWAGVF